jgi:hypothetical protein
MLEKLGHSAFGHILIRDKNTKETIREKYNAIHFGNLNTAFAKSLVGDSSGFITYMAFGNAGSIISGTTINYKTPRVSDVENTIEQLYSTTYVQKLTNAATPPAEVISNNLVEVPVGQGANPYKDIVVSVTLGYGDNGPVGQNIINNGQLNDNFVFDEIALYAGPRSLIPGQNTSDLVEIQGFTNSVQSLMLTHVIFSPVEKAQNVELEIIYTIRVQAGISL